MTNAECRMPMCMFGIRHPPEGIDADRDRNTATVSA